MKTLTFIVSLVCLVCLNTATAQAQWPEVEPGTFTPMLIPNYSANCSNGNAFRVDSFGISVGDYLPNDMALFGVAGTKYQYNQFCGPSIFLPASVTCPGTRVFARMIKNALEQFPGVNVFLVNTVEIHPEIGPSPCSLVVGDSFPSLMNIPYYLFPQITMYGEQVSRVEYFRNSLDIPGSCISLLDGPESPFLSLWGGPFGGFVTDSCGRVIYEFPTSTDTITEEENLNAVIANMALGIEKIRLDESFVFPNPAQDIISVNNTDEGEIIIVDCFGNVMKKAKIKSRKGIISLDVSTLPTGLYYLKHKNSYQKFVKN